MLPRRGTLMNSIRFRLSILVFEVVALGVAALPAQSRPTITLTVDATQAPEKMLHTRMVMPVKPGPLTLYYPKWIPGAHGPSGPVGSVAGLKFMANGKAIAWRRDLLDVFTFHLDVPEGADSLEASIRLHRARGRRSGLRWFRHRQAGDCQLEPKRAVSRGSPRQGDHLQADPAPASRVEVRNRTAARECCGQRDHLQAGCSGSLGRLAGDCRRILSRRGRDAARRADPARDRHGGRQRGGARNEPGGAEGLHESGDGDRQTLWRTALPRLPLPADLEQSRGAFRPRAP